MTDVSEMATTELAKAMENHVSQRGGAQFENSARQMMREASYRLSWYADHAPCHPVSQSDSRNFLDALGRGKQ